MIIWKNTCGESWQHTIENGWEVSGKPGAFLFFIPKGALTHHLQSRRWYPSRWSGSCALHELSFRQFSRGGRQCRKRTFPVQSALYLLYQQNDEVAYCHPHLAACLRKPATGSFYAVMGIAFSATPIFSFQKRNRKKGR